MPHDVAVTRPDRHPSRRELTWLRARGRLLLAAMLPALGGCASLWQPDPRLDLPMADRYGSINATADNYRYLIGPGDGLNIFVWRNPEVSTGVTVRPDGMITTPLVEDLRASGKTPTQLAREIEEALSYYIRQPIVTVTVSSGLGPYTEQIRVTGAAANPQALNYREGMTLLDLMITVGGTGEFADGNNATLMRMVAGQPTQYRLRIDDLLKGGDLSANVEVLPGDVIIIPESWF